MTYLSHTGRGDAVTLINNALAVWEINNFPHSIDSDLFSDTPEITITWHHPGSKSVYMPPVAVLSWYIDDDGEEYIGYATYYEPLNAMVAGGVDLSMSELETTIPTDLIKTLSETYS